jgi:multiple sugar transport system permease protein
MRPVRLVHLAMLAPAQSLLVVVLLVPSFWVLWLSFQTSTFGREAQWVGLANYARLIADPYFWRAFVNTVVVVLVVVHVELIAGLAIALLFAGGVPARKLMIAVVLAPYAISEVSAVVMWRYLMDPEVGIVSKSLASLGLPTLEWAVNPTHGLAIVSLLSIWLHLPFTFVILYSARLAIPEDLYEAARIDGGSPWQMFRHVTLPLLVPAMLVTLLFRTIFAFRLFSEVWLMTQGGPARSSEVLAVYLYLEAFRYNAFGVAAATGWLMVLASVFLAAWYLAGVYRRMFAHE